MLFDRYFIYFVIYAIIGYISEVLYCSIPKRRFMNRGFLHGPYLPIYGFGALLIVTPLQYFSTHLVGVFLLAFFLTTALEYATSVLLEKLFHTQLWNYSNNFANIRGRVCLLNSTLFGLMGVGATYWLHPWITQSVARIPQSILHPVSSALLILISVDATSSIMSMSAFQRQLSEFRKRVVELEQRFELLAKQKSTPALEKLQGRLRDELEERRARLNKRARRILNAFPSITAKSEEERLQLELLKMEYRTYRQKRKEQRKK